MSEATGPCQEGERGKRQIERVGVRSGGGSTRESGGGCRTWKGRTWAPQVTQIRGPHGDGWAREKIRINENCRERPTSIIRLGGACFLLLSASASILPAYPGSLTRSLLKRRGEMRQPMPKGMAIPTTAIETALCPLRRRTWKKARGVQGKGRETEGQSHRGILHLPRQAPPRPRSAGLGTSGSSSTPTRKR